MTTNAIIRHTDPTEDQTLISNLVREQIQIRGLDVQYMPRTLIEEDTLFGEDKSSIFSDAHTIEIYVRSYDGFEGDGDIFGNFGLVVKDTIKLECHISRFTAVTGQSRPLEGDLIYFPTSRTVFQVSFVEHEKPFYQIGELYVYVITAKAYEFSHEEMDTGDATIDSIETTFLNNDSVENDNGADNTQIETEADDSLVNFDESSPFGTY